MRSRARLRAQFGGPSVDKALGALPVVAEFCRRLEVAGIVDRACPVREVALVTHGQVIEALVANRLTSPTPLVHVQDWASQWAVEEVWGIEAAVLNDDRIGRALDAIAPELDRIIGSVGARAITTFGLPVARLHWDLTSISLYGAYPDPDNGFPTPRYGHPKDRRPDLKQVQTGLAVTGDPAGGVPVFHRAYDGGAGEVAQVIGAMTALQQLAGPKRLLLVGDSKLISYPNLRAMIAAKVGFIAPASKTYVPAATFAALEPDTATPVDYVAARDQHKPPERRGSYRVLEDTMTLAGKRKADPVLSLRRVLVWSSARAQAAATNRARKLERAHDDLGRLERGLGSRHYPDHDAVTARVRAIATSRKLVGVLVAEVATDPATGKPTLAWHFDQAAVHAQARTDGWYALVTNLDPAQGDAGEILRRYKGQEVVERRYGAFKGPLAMAPMVLKDNRRIAALITVICLALLIFCLVERQIRRAIAPAEKLDGCGPAVPPSPPGSCCSPPWPGCGCFRPAAPTRRSFPGPHPCKHASWSCSKSTPPAHADRPQAPMRPPRPPILMCGTPA
jgi:hypothetical protein